MSLELAELVVALCVAIVSWWTGHEITGPRKERRKNGNSGNGT